MAKITAPNAAYNGESATVKFENGVGHTDDPNLITWFRENGYAVEETNGKTNGGDASDEKPLDKMNKAELCAAAEAKGIKVVPDEMTKAQIIAALKGE
jgi:hypothetical protein